MRRRIALLAGMSTVAAALGALAGPGAAGADNCSDPPRKLPDGTTSAPGPDCQGTAGYRDGKVGGQQVTAAGATVLTGTAAGWVLWRAGQLQPKPGGGGWRVTPGSPLADYIKARNAAIAARDANGGVVPPKEAQALIDARDKVRGVVPGFDKFVNRTGGDGLIGVQIAPGTPVDMTGYGPASGGLSPADLAAGVGGTGTGAGTGTGTGTGVASADGSATTAGTGTGAAPGGTGTRTGTTPTGDSGPGPNERPLVDPSGVPIPTEASTPDAVRDVLKRGGEAVISPDTFRDAWRGLQMTRGSIGVSLTGTANIGGRELPVEIPIQMGQGPFSLGSRPLPKEAFPQPGAYEAYLKAYNDYVRAVESQIRGQLGPVKEVYLDDTRGGNRLHVKP